MDYFEASLQKHKSLKGKISITPKDTLDDQTALSIYYTPGVARVSEYVAKNPEQTKDYTWTNNNVAVISDGSAVLGLGNIGPEGALPVMEGKAMIFKSFANIDAIPIVLNVHTADEIVNAVLAIAPSFGGINLEDIAAPQCFEIEDRVKEALRMPIMHDDQHGTAVVVLAGLINAMRVVDKSLSQSKIVVVGAGAAGIAITKLIYEYAKPEIIMVDSKGILSKSRKNLNAYKKRILQITNPHDVDGDLQTAMNGADIFIGVSQPGLLTRKMIGSMKPGAVIFAMANPTPEIMPEKALAAGASIIATGRSDFPNQINNALAFPGIFRGALDNNVDEITERHKLAAAEAIARLIQKPTQECIIPNVFDKKLVPAIARVIV